MSVNTISLSNAFTITRELNTREDNYIISLIFKINEKEKSTEAIPLTNIIDYCIERYKDMTLNKHVEFVDKDINLAEIAKNIWFNANHYINDNNLIIINEIEVQIKQVQIKQVYSNKVISYKSYPKILLFDLDDTLYTDKDVLKQQVNLLMSKCADYYNITWDLLTEYYIKYGASFEGLKLHHEADDKVINDLMYDIYTSIDVSKIPFNEKLHNLVQKTDLPCAIISNAPAFYVNRVLNKLQIKNKIIDMITPSHDNFWIFKTCKDYNKILSDRYGDKTELIIFDDNQSNCDMLTLRPHTETIKITKNNPIEVALKDYLEAS